MVMERDEGLSEELVGLRVRLDASTDPASQIQPGSEGVIVGYAHGVMHVEWDNGSHSSLIFLQGDRFSVLFDEAVS